MNGNPRLELILTIYLRRIKNHTPILNNINFENGTILPREILDQLMENFKGDKLNIVQNYMNLDHRAFPVSFFEYVIGINYLKRNSTKSTVEKSIIEIIKQHASTIFTDYQFNYPAEAYYTHLYSIPIPQYYINKINSAVFAEVQRERFQSYDIIKTFGKHTTPADAENWVRKKHPEVLITNPELTCNYLAATFSDRILSFIYICHLENKGKYNSKISIAKKIYNFRGNSKKKKNFYDNTESVKLQVEIHTQTMRYITAFSSQHQLEIGRAVEVLVEYGFEKISHATTDAIKPRQTIPRWRNSKTRSF